MTGSTRIEGTAQDFRWYNTLYMFGPGGRMLAAYDKTHLVPFGEYLPYPAVMDALGVSQLTGITPATPGDGRHRYIVPGAPNVTPLICYEAIFPGAVAAPEGRAGWFVNVTDDSWFGPWAGPAQHLMTARMRTIEEGIPMARAANTGISAVIDGHGRIIGKLGLNQVGVVDTTLPAALGPTPYSRFGDWGFVVLLIVSLGLAFITPRLTF
jgi:apolipoprotein N-acyltransferase